ncbi:MAG: ABC transporter permease, partial [Candidatus Binatia bacterium]
FFWWILEPLIFMAIYYVLVQVVLHRGGPGYPLFLFCGILPWRWFAVATSQSVSGINGAAGIVRQLAFPRAVYPVATVSAHTVYFFFGLLVLFGFMVFYGQPLSLALFFLPYVMVVQYLFTLALALVLASLGVFLADLQITWGLGLRAWFYLSPILYSLDRVPEPYRFWFTLNPFSILVEAYRSMVLEGEIPNLSELAIMALLSLLFTLFAFLFFTWLEPRFAKVL